MTGQPDHLTDEAGAALAEGIDERVYFVRSKRWIAYPKAVEILGHLNALLKHPRTTRMPSLAVYGDSGMGKSMLVEKFKDDYARNADDRPNGPKTKLLVVELAGRPNERRLYAQILAVSGAPQNPRATIVELGRTAVRLLGNLGVQVLVLDEIHNVLAASWRAIWETGFRGIRTPSRVWPRERGNLGKSLAQLAQAALTPKRRTRRLHCGGPSFESPQLHQPLDVFVISG